MSYFLVVRNIRIQHANALASNYAISTAPVMALNLFAHNLGLKIFNPVIGIGIIHHDAQILGELGDGFHRASLQQRKAATLIDGNDYISSSMTLSLQPTATAHLRLSLVVELEYQPSVADVEDFLRNARIAGGRVESFDYVGFAHSDSDDLDDLLPASGWWLIDREDLMRRHANPAQAMVDALGRVPIEMPHEELAASAELHAEEEEASGNLNWLVPTVLGYAATCDFDKRTGVRMLGTGEFPVHAYAEPLLGLAQYVSIRERSAAALPIWRTEWITDDVFVTRCNP